MKSFFTLWIIIVLFSSSCDTDRPYTDCEYPDYSDCITNEPEYGLVKVKLTINDSNKNVPLTIYYGNPESETICIIDTIDESSVEYILPAGVYYAAKAEYKSGDKIINAFDSGLLEKKSYEVCDSICWVVKDINLDIELGY
ncbi:MAG: hypothetical protein PHT69_11130 [Bacteroidales bacterium]|nr:hypothetical protein [Bacteroidales bacterium]